MTMNTMPYPSMMSLVDDLWAYIVLAFTVLTSSKANLVFVGFFAFRYTRLIINAIAYYGIYKPTPIPANPTIYPRDCTVIIPTVDPENAGFQECIRTVLENRAGAVLIVAVGKDKLKLIKKVVKPLQAKWPATTISVTASDIANKRLQVCHAIPQVKTALTVLVDDHVYWPSNNFLPTICAPFEDPKVGGLGTNKVVRRSGSGYSLSSIFNFWGCIYLERHNFELTATNAIDGSVFVLSGRTSAHRTAILQDKDFLAGFSNEMFFFGKYGPIAADDDNFITRWEVKKGWNIKFQNCPDATIETDLGEPHKFLSQCMRWVRTTWRSNSCSLFTDRTVWRRQPWGVYAIYITSFFNFALFYDSALIYTLTKTTFGQSRYALYCMAVWIFASKMIKLIPHMRRNPSDIMLVPAYLAFAYFHSFMKFWALLTFWDIQWSGRNLAAVNAQAQIGDDSDDSDSDDDDDMPDMSNWDLNNGDYAARKGPKGGVSPPSRRSSIASSTGSASYGISLWSAWEKASNHSDSVLRSRFGGPSHRLSSVNEQEELFVNDLPGFESLQDWLSQDVGPGNANSPSQRGSPPSSVRSRPSSVRPLSDYEPEGSASPLGMNPANIPMQSVEMPANPFKADDDLNSIDASSPTSSVAAIGRQRSASPSPSSGPTRFLSADLASNSSGSSFRSGSTSSSSSSGSSNPRSTSSSNSGSSTPKPSPRNSRSPSRSPPRPSSYWADFPAAGIEAPLPSPFTYSTSASRSSSNPGHLSDLDDNAPRSPSTPLATSPEVRPAMAFASPPRPQAVAAVPSSPVRATGKATKRTRGNDCGRQHEEGHRISGTGLCALPGYIGEVGLPYGGGGKRQRRSRDAEV